MKYTLEIDIEVELIETVTRRDLPDVVFRMSGFSKVMGALMPFMFKEQSFSYMKNFKAFAEAEG